MAILAGMIGIVSFLVFMVGIAGLFKPSLLSTKDKPATRKTAIATIISSFIISIFAAIISPDPGSPSELEQTQPSLNPNIPDNAKPEVKQLLQANWPKIKQACPGLDKYAKDLQSDGVEDNFDVARPDVQRASVKLNVSDNAQIPAEYRSRGHTCYYEVSRDGSKLTIPKRPCVSICLDKDMSKDNSDPFTISLK